MKVILLGVVMLAVLSLSNAQTPEAVNEVYDNMDDSETNPLPVAPGERISALSEEERLKNLQVITQQDGTAPKAKIPTNPEGVKEISAEDDLRHQDNKLVKDPEAEKKAIDGLVGGQDREFTETDQQGEDEESSDKVDDDQARWERLATASLQHEVKRTKPLVKEAILPNPRKPEWPLALRASPRLPVTAQELQRTSRPRDLVIAYDWRGACEERKGMRFPNMPELNTPDWTISFWIKLSAPSTTGGWKNILNKGHNSKDRAPGIWLSGANRLWTRLFTDHHEDEGFHSKASLEVGVATHVAVVRRGRTFALFINGQLDSHMVTIGSVVYNDGPLHISRSPGYLGFNGELYTFRWYSRGLPISEIRSDMGVGSTRPVTDLKWAKGFTNDDLDSVSIPHHSSMEGVQFTIAFWMNLEQDSTGLWRSVFHKGGLEAMTPSCFLMPNSRLLSCHISTTHTPDEQVISKSLIPLHTPTHVALVREGRVLTIYINGEKDASIETKGYTTHNVFQLNIGTSRWSHKNQEYSAGFVGAVSSFVWFDIPFNNMEIRTQMERTAPGPVLQLDTKIDYQSEDRTIIPHLSVMMSQAFTLSFWVNLREQSPRKANKVHPDRDWNLIVRKGATDQQNTPSIWYKPSMKASKIQVRVSTSHTFREIFDSVASVKVNTPTRIAITLQGKVLKLYINDEEDSVFILRGVPVLNYGPLFFGSDPSADGTKGELEDLRWYNRALTHSELLTVSPHKVFRYWTPPLVGGPSVRVGNRVEFNGFSMMTFPDTNLRSKTYSVLFWITLGQNPEDIERVLFGKGNEKTAFFPLVTLTTDNKIKIRLQTTHSDHFGESKISASSISTGAPFHVALVVEERDVRLYINGILDSYFSTIGDPILNTEPWRVGKGALRPGVVARINDFMIYNHALLEDEVRVISDGLSSKPVFDFRWNGDFDGTNMVKVPHNTAIGSAEMTISCWVTVTEQASGTFRVIWQKGDSNNQRTPSMALRPNANKLQASISSSRLAVEVVTSEHILAIGVPTHVAYVLRGHEHSIYINGLLDSTAPIQGDVIFNEGPLTIGKSMWAEGMVGNVRGLSVYPRALDPQEVMEFAAAVHVPASIAFDLVGKFNGRDMMVVPHSPIFDSNSYSILFWITLRSPPNNEWSTVLHKGAKNSERAPGIFLYPYEHKLYFAISTQQNPNAGMTANTTLTQNVPSHVAMVVSTSNVRVYIDGAHQGTLLLDSPIATNSGPLYLMKDNWYAGTDAVLTGFRIFPEAMDAAAIVLSMNKDERF